MAEEIESRKKFILEKKDSKLTHLNREKIDFFSQMSNWSHFVTLTYSGTKHGHAVGEKEILRRTRLFLSKLNRQIFGRHGCRRHNFRIGSFAVLGWGIYGSHPHTHWLLEKPKNLSVEEFVQQITLIISTTSGIAKQFDIQSYESKNVIQYMLDHGLDTWIAEVAFRANTPKN